MNQSDSICQISESTIHHRSAPENGTSACRPCLTLTFLQRILLLVSLCLSLARSWFVPTLAVVCSAAYHAFSFSTLLGLLSLECVSLSKRTLFYSTVYHNRVNFFLRVKNSLFLFVNVDRNANKKFCNNLLHFTFKPCFKTNSFK